MSNKTILAILATLFAACAQAGIINYGTPADAVNGLTQRYEADAKLPFEKLQAETKAASDMVAYVAAHRLDVNFDKRKWSESLYALYTGGANSQCDLIKSGFSNLSKTISKYILTDTNIAIKDVAARLKGKSVADTEELNNSNGQLQSIRGNLEALLTAINGQIQSVSKAKNEAIKWFKTITKT